MATRSDKPSTRRASSRNRAQDPASSPESQRTPNEEASPETLIPDVVNTRLTRDDLPSDTDRGRWISERAYELAQARGFTPGAELDDWLQAEREFDARQQGQARPGDQFTG